MRRTTSIAAAKAPARDPSSRDAISGPPGDIGTMTPGASGRRPMRDVRTERVLKFRRRNNPCRCPDLRHRALNRTGDWYPSQVKSCGDSRPERKAGVAMSRLPGGRGVRKKRNVRERERNRCASSRTRRRRLVLQHGRIPEHLDDPRQARSCRPQVECAPRSGKTGASETIQQRGRNNPAYLRRKNTAQHQPPRGSVR